MLVAHDKPFGVSLPWRFGVSLSPAVLDLPATQERWPDMRKSDRQCMGHKHGWRMGVADGACIDVTEAAWS